LDNFKEYVKKITFIWICIFAFLCGIFTYTKSSSILISPEGIYNLFSYLLDALTPSLIITGLICMALLGIRLIFWVMLLAFTLGSRSQEEDSFVYVVDTEDEHGD